MKQYGTVSLVLGLVSIPALFLFALGIPLALAAVVTGGLGVARERGRAGRAVAGIVLGLAALVGAGFLIARPDS